MSQDDEVAEIYLQQAGVDMRTPEVRLSEWSPEMAALTIAVERIGTVAQAVIAAAGGKAPDFKPMPRPVVAADRLRSKNRRAQYLRLREKVLPKT